MQKRSQHSQPKADLEAIRKMNSEETNRLAAEARAEIGMEDGGFRFERADLRPKVKEIRESLGLSQSAFCQTFGLRLRTLQHWEQERMIPDRAAIILLKTIQIAPEAVQNAVHLLSTPGTEVPKLAFSQMLVHTLSWKLTREDCREIHLAPLSTGKPELTLAGADAVRPIMGYVARN